MKPPVLTAARRCRHSATRDVWRFLFEIDWTDRVVAYHLPLDHPLPLLVDRINKLRLTIWDALWIRLVDVPAALAGRTYASDGRVTVEVVSDPHFPDNVGTWTIENGTHTLWPVPAWPQIIWTYLDQHPR